MSGCSHVGGIVRHPSGRARIVVCSDLLDIALVELLDDAGEPTGRHAAIRPSKLRPVDSGDNRAIPTGETAAGNAGGCHVDRSAVRARTLTRHLGRRVLQQLGEAAVIARPAARLARAIRQFRALLRAAYPGRERSMLALELATYLVCAGVGLVSLAL